MKENIDRLFQRPMPPIEPGLPLRRAENFQVDASYNPDLEGKREGERFYIIPLSAIGQEMLGSASAVHRIDNFEDRFLFLNSIGFVKCLRADYIPQNALVLFHNVVEIPREGEDTIPSIDRMEALISRGETVYTFDDQVFIEL